MNSDVATVVFSFLPWEEVVQVCSAVSTLWHMASVHTSRQVKKRLCLLEENVRLALEDKVVNEQLARRWLSEKVSRNVWFGKTPRAVIGCLCDTRDFQNSYSFATIVGWSKRPVQFGLLAPCTVTHRTNAIRAGLSPGSIVRQRIETQYLVRFLGWSHRWDEWKSMSALFPLGSKTMIYVKGLWVSRKTQQWIIRRNFQNRKVWELCLYSRFADPPHDSLPLTDVTASLLVGRKLPHMRM